MKRLLGGWTAHMILGLIGVGALLWASAGSAWACPTDPPTPTPQSGFQWPWEARSTATVAYLPEQVVWCLLVAFALIGLPFAFRRDVIVAGLLVGHAVVAAATVALISGNIGTLVRHRGLALPYFVWISGVGACQLLAAWRPRTAHVDSR